MKKWIWFLFVALMLCGMSIPVYASIDSGLETVEMDYIERKRISENIRLNAVAEPAQGLIEYVAVNNKGEVAIALGRCKINVYNAKGDFLYGYSFRTLGSYWVDWDADQLVIVFTRGRIAVKADPMAQIVTMHDVLHKTENTAYIENVLKSTAHTSTSGYHVEMHNRRLGPLALLAWGKVYSEVVVTDPHGNATVIYDVRARLVLWRAFVLASFIFLVWRGFKIDKARRAKAALTDKEEE